MLGYAKAPRIDIPMGRAASIRVDGNPQKTYDNSEVNLTKLYADMENDWTDATNQTIADFLAQKGSAATPNGLIKPRKDHRGVDLISDTLPFGRLW